MSKSMANRVPSNNQSSTLRVVRWAALSLGLIGTLIIPGLYWIAPYSLPQLKQLDQLAPFAPSWIAMACCVPMGFLGRRQIVYFLIAILFCGYSTYLAQQNGPLAELLENPNDSPAYFDLDQGLVPADTHGFLAIQGTLQTNFVLDEYHVETGQRPDQNEPADIVLMAMLGQNEQALDPQHWQVIARVAKDHPREPARQLLIGHLHPAPSEVIGALIDIRIPESQNEGPLPSPSQRIPKGAILDTLNLPSLRMLRFRSTLALALGFLSISLLIAAARRKAAPDRARISPES